jgi:glycosyltransferase involved in cell wall biosynthesis
VPRVSVIIATYNWSSVLPYSIGSVLDQTMSDFEVLVVGDNCNDDSEAVVAGIGDPRVRWINLSANSGHQSAPNNEGIRQAKGELIAYLGHDDLWLTQHLELLVNAIDQSGGDMAHSITAQVNANGEVFPVTAWPEAGSWGPPSCTLHRRSVMDAVGGWRDYRGLKVPPEIDLWRRARQAGLRFTSLARLTAIKFPASSRRNVYQIRPCHEQAAWFARIATEPDLEAVMLARMIADRHDVRSMPYRQLLARLVSQTFVRMRRRIAHRLMRGLFPTRKNAVIEATRRLKGL